jgi:hypothetical protein
MLTIFPLIIFSLKCNLTHEKKVINNPCIKSIEKQANISSPFNIVEIFTKKVSDSGKKCANKSIFTVQNNIENQC